jgi:hypothetical protein
VSCAKSRAGTNKERISNKDFMRDEFTNKILIFCNSLQAKVFNFEIVENNKAPT